MKRSPKLAMQVLVCLAMAFAVTLPAQAADRIALLFGMGEYRSVAPLDNTHRDATAIAGTLEDIGFEVTALYDAGRAEMQDALDQFAFEAETADLALIYFAGHGVQVGGENFFLPVDAAISSIGDVRDQSLTLNNFLASVDHARKMRIVILDSCRDNPFLGSNDAIDLGSEDDTAGGLAAANPERGTLVAYAARDGQVAFDGAGGNSPFAKALVEHLPRQDVEISLMFRQVRDAVLAATGNLQEPYTYGSLSGVPFFLAGASDEDTRIASADPRQAWDSLRPEQALQLAALAETGDTRSLLGLAYMRLNPDGDAFQPDDAAGFLERAAAAGSAEAQYELAKLYEQGMGVAPDPDRALELFRQSADQDFADAINDLGFLTYQGALGLRADPQAALGLFERAADLRHPQAMYNFAALIDDGLIPGKGSDDAAGYLYRALRTGNRDVLAILSERPADFTLATRQELQRILTENAFYGGAIDGDFGQGTQRGLRRAYGLEE